MFSGDTIGKYRLVTRLGRGGMGEVWLATASGYGGFTKTVVLKTLLPELACDPLFIEMLATEARICATLSHPNLIEVFDFTEHGGIYLLAMEHVMGRPLNHIMRAAHERAWQLPPWFPLRLAWECCRGLEYAHEQGIIHCDLSPSNVMVTFTGVTKILDFGVAHSSERGPKADRLKGKFSYMAPERIKSRTTDRRSDVYALGVMLYLLFTGQLPFSGNTDAELLHRIVHELPRPPSELCAIDPSIEQLILRAMQPDPSARHQTISEVLAALSPALDGHLGTYGQRDMAALLASLFPPKEAQSARAVQLPLPPADDTSASGTRYLYDELDSFDIEVESSILEIAREAPAASLPIVEVRRMARGSAPVDPVKPTLPTIPTLPTPPLKPLVAVFENVPDPHEARTTVQSLFEERPSVAFGHSRVFDRAPLEAQFELDTEPEPAVETSKGVFGGAPSSRSAAPVNWPWPRSSRSKSG